MCLRSGMTLTCEWYSAKTSSKQAPKGVLGIRISVHTSRSNSRSRIYVAREHAVREMTHQCSYAKFSLWCAMHHLAWIEPPRLTMPVKRLAVCGTKDSSTPAWMVK